ncbi:MAG: YbaK/EbsC family protein [Gammaproteobacteria bacterium]|nr:YbaK/EbsC family protein [Gammaproteobacteria bacterium]NIR97163.1 YbaK/EbsC family protein [Gammaproteobacteria bacterium]NIT62865.1 YbaK/EbsC family protein [Gammaproteobacteria bacterium]NIV19830.1 deacylase [Gammaproteobacteria bacterium]NIY31445.1 deacylase [Gammaproteobacteria bacterium]
MAIPHSLEQFLHTHRIAYDVVSHPRTESAQRTAAAAHVPGDRLAKSVILEDDNGYVMAVIPSTHRLDLGKLHHQTQRILGLAVEQELTDLFTDCDPGAVPPVGAAYGIDTIVDDALMEQPEVYLEAGDHEELIHVDRAQFETLMNGAARGQISHHS